MIRLKNYTFKTSFVVHFYGTALKKKKKKQSQKAEQMHRQSKCTAQNISIASPASYHLTVAQIEKIDVEMSRLTTKPTKWHVRRGKTQISLGIRPVWSVSSLSAWRKLGALATHTAHSEDSAQTGRMPRLNWVFAWRTYHFVGFEAAKLQLDRTHFLKNFIYVY